jgi:hypothetical protein
MVVRDRSNNNNDVLCHWPRREDYCAALVWERLGMRDLPLGG